jgi:hypothetical protein
MNSDIPTALAKAARQLLRPLVRILLRNGVAYGQFAELARQVYVDVAWQEFTPPGRKQSASRVAVLTGLTRKDVRKLIEQPGEQADGEPPDAGLARYNRAVRVISGWLRDAEFHTADGQPAALPLHGESVCFDALVRRYSGDMPTRAMLDVLVAAGSVKVQADSVQLLSRAFVPSSDAIDKIAILGRDTAELLSTIDHNLSHPREQARYQRKVSSDSLRADQVEAFRLLAAAQSQALLEQLDGWLSVREVPPGETGQTRAVSVGVYYYEEDGGQAADHEQEKSA